MTLILSGTNGLSDVDGSAATPAIRGTDANTGIFFPAADTIAFSEGGAEAMRIDSSGNVGIGIASPATKLDVSNGSIRASNTGGYYTNLTATGLTNSATTMDFDSASSYIFKVSASEKMRLDASGNLGVGTTSPLGKLHVSGSGLSSIYMSDSGEATDQKNWAFQYGTGVGTGTFRLRALNDANNSGQNAYIITRTGVAVDTHQWLTANTERARIDTSGNLLVGTTSSTGKITVTAANGTSPIGYFVNSTSSGNVSGIGTSIESNGNNTSSYHLRSITQNINVWYLYGNGTTSFSSDQRLKKNIETARNGYADDLCKLRVVKYNWHNQDDGTPKELGLIAQEVEQVFPNLIQEIDDRTVLNGIENTKVLKGSVLPFMLLKAIQEQQALITALTARLDAANL